MKKLSDNTTERFLTPLQSAIQYPYEIEIGKENFNMPNNSIKTNKYSLINFLPLSLFEQFRKAANIYFIFIAILQTLPEVSITNQIPVIITPLSMVIVISVIKDLYEVLGKYFSDRRENMNPVAIINNNELVVSNWGEPSGDLKEGSRE